jgi:hypothetical protein
MDNNLRLIKFHDRVEITKIKKHIFIGKKYIFLKRFSFIKSVKKDKYLINCYKIYILNKEKIDLVRSK